jgi:hypothetical protein
VFSQARGVSEVTKVTLLDADLAAALILPNHLGSDILFI